MNPAFNSLLIILLILPGFIFSLALYNSDEPFHYAPLTYKTIIELLENYYLDKKGELDCLILNSARRTRI